MIEGIGICLVILYNKPIFNLMLLAKDEKQINNLSLARKLRRKAKIEVALSFLLLIPYFFILRLLNEIYHFLPNNSWPIIELLPITCSLINIYIINKIIKRLEKTKRKISDYLGGC